MCDSSKTDVLRSPRRTKVVRPKDNDMLRYEKVGIAVADPSWSVVMCPDIVRVEWEYHVQLMGQITHDCCLLGFKSIPEAVICAYQGSDKSTTTQQS
jgi:hypothetical protein